MLRIVGNDHSARHLSDDKTIVGFTWIRWLTIEMYSVVMDMSEMCAV
jgi:hypothetical protein